MAATPHPEPEHGGSVVRNRASLLQMLDDIDREAGTARRARRC